MTFRPCWAARNCSTAATLLSDRKIEGGMPGAAVVPSEDQEMFWAWAAAESAVIAPARQTFRRTFRPTRLVISHPPQNTMLSTRGRQPSFRSAGNRSSMREGRFEELIAAA